MFEWLQLCDSSPPLVHGQYIHSSSWKPSHLVTGGRDGVKIWHVVFCLRIALILKSSSRQFSLHTYDKYWTAEQYAAGKRAHTHRYYTYIETDTKKNKLVTLQWARTHTPHTLVPWMKADIRPCLQQGEVGDILSEFFNTTDLTTPRAEKVDSFSPYTLQLFFSPPCTLLQTHTHTQSLTSVVWNGVLGREEGVQSKARELSEECIQHTLDRMEVQMVALIVQAEHKECTSQSKAFSKQSTNQGTLSPRKHENAISDDSAQYSHICYYHSFII